MAERFTSFSSDPLNKRGGNLISCPAVTNGSLNEQLIPAWPNDSLHEQLFQHDQVIH